MACWLRKLDFSERSVFDQTVILANIRSDGESAVVAVLKTLTALRGNDTNDEPFTIIEETPNQSTVSLGSAKIFAETLGGVVRTLQQDVKDRRHVKIRANSMAFA
eukprot:10006446-Heterocapsa_arctica.AAC.1